MSLYVGTGETVNRQGDFFILPSPSLLDGYLTFVNPNSSTRTFVITEVSCPCYS